MSLVPDPSKGMFFLLLFLVSLSTSGQQVGDIHFSAALDDPAFVVCDTQWVFQYYNTGSWYKEHKRSIEQYFREHYNSPTIADSTTQTGYITIRFVINCQGHTGWFRLSEMDSGYHAFHFDPRISGQLLDETKTLEGWKPAVYRNKTYDSYQYITFKLKRGHIECLLP
jgi:hypothetical protein